MDCNEKLLADSLENSRGPLLEVVKYFLNLLPDQFLSIKPLLEGLNMLCTSISASNLILYLKWLEINVEGNAKEIKKINSVLTPENQSLLMERGFKKILNSLSEQKIKRIAAVVANSVTKFPEIDFETKIDCLEFCDELNERDILILREFDNYQRLNVYEVASKIIPNIENDNVNLSRINMACAKLVSRGLIMKSEKRVEQIIDTGGTDSSYKNLEEVTKETIFEILPVGSEIVKLFTNKKDTF